MNKQEFLAELRKQLSGLPQSDVEERLAFYGEIIEDRVEEGVCEEEAVLSLGTVEEVASQILADIPFTRIAKAKMKTKKRLSVWEIVLLALGSPIWLSLIIAVFAILLSTYVSIWAIVVSLWAVFATFVGCGFGGIVGGVGFMVAGHQLSGVILIASGIICAGLSIFMFMGCKAATKGTIIFTGKMVLGVKKCFIKKGENHE